MTTPTEFVGRVIAERYRIVELIGSGGMGEVYRAEHLQLHRACALKVVRPALLGDPEVLARFRREAEQASRISHPNVATIYDFGETTEGLLYLTMEFVEGESLAGRIAREGALPREEASRVIRQAAEGLQAAHRRGVLHRDLKPANIMVVAGAGGDTQAGAHVKLVDFGIARSMVAEPDSGSAAPLTRTGISVGTPAYASPEQLAGEPVDQRSDLYSLALVAYEALTGRTAFGSSANREQLVQRLSGRPRPLAEAGDAGAPAWPAAAQAVFDRALSPRPEERFPDAVTFARALTAALGVGHPTPTGEQPTLPPLRAARRPRRVVLLAVAAVALGAVVAVGGLRHLGRHAAGAAAPVIAVLPFENLGDSSDVYFADGMADEVRAKLAGVPGIQVLARTSSNEYRHSSKRPAQIGEELGADYLLTATVRWEKRPAGDSRVRVTPELIRAENSRTTWQQPFDAVMSDVFQVQSDIAARVAQALDVALGAGARQQLTARPTDNLAAYDAYLRGEAAFYRSNEPRVLREAIADFEQAVALDPGFALAWARLAIARSRFYSLGTSTAVAAAAARQAVERAMALAPDRPESYLARGVYRSACELNNELALRDLIEAARLAPFDAELLSRMATVEERLGRWDDAIRHLQEAQRRDPRANLVARDLAEALLRMRRYTDASAAVARARQLAPTDPFNAEVDAMVALAQGDLARARRIVGAASATVERSTLLAFFGDYYDLYWVLDDADQRDLLRLRPSAFDDDTASWAVVLAQTAHVRGDRVAARAYADSGLAASEQLAHVTAVQDPQRHVFLGMLYALAGRPADAIREGERGEAMLPVSRDARDGAYLQHVLTRLYLAAGQQGKALDHLEPLLRMPYYLSPAWLRIDPSFKALRGNPRFEKLLAGT